MVELKIISKLNLFLCSLVPLYSYLPFWIKTNYNNFFQISWIIAIFLVIWSVINFLHFFKFKKSPQQNLTIKNYQLKTSTYVKNIAPIIVLFGSTLLNLEIIAIFGYVIFYLVLQFIDEENLLNNILIFLLLKQIVDIEDINGNKFILLTSKRKFLKNVKLNYYEINGSIIKEWQ